MKTDEELFDIQQKAWSRLNRGGSIRPSEIEPTGGQCRDRAFLISTGDAEWWACWYPQMGGYCGKCIVILSKTGCVSNTCFEVVVWHNGDFPFSGESPAHLHHCDPQQFIDFGNTVANLQKRNPPHKED